MRPIIATTKHRGVFYGLVAEDYDVTPSTLELKGARMAIRFGTTKGISQLAETGPTNQSRIGSRADVLIHDVTAVFTVTEAAAAKWEAA